MTRKGQAWDACNRLQPIWQSNLIFQGQQNLPFLEPVWKALLYGSETWIMMKKALQDWLDGTYNIHRASKETYSFLE